MRAEPRLLLISLGLALSMMLPDALLALWLSLLVSGIVDGDDTRVTTAAIGLALSSTATWYLSVLSQRVQRRFRDRIAIALRDIYYDVPVESIILPPRRRQPSQEEVAAIPEDDLAVGRVSNHKPASVQL